MSLCPTCGDNAAWCADFREQLVAEFAARSDWHARNADRFRRNLVEVASEDTE